MLKLSGKSMDRLLGIPHCLMLVVSLITASFSQANERLGGLLGAEVLTTDGTRIGEIVDAAFDAESHRINYYVVAIGSFLIEDSLIAVHPDAMAFPTTDQGIRINATTESLAAAKRFSPDSWPEQADVLRSASGSESDSASDPTVAATPSKSASTGSATGGLAGLQNHVGNRIRGSVRNQPGLSSVGSATISDGRRQATLADGKKEIAQIEPFNADKGVAKPAPAAPLPSYQRLDQNNDGRLSRREIGAHLGGLQSYADLDLDASGGIDSFEYDAFKEARNQKN